MTTDIKHENVSPARDGSGAMFDRIAARYDLLNRLISLGIDTSWRRRTVSALDVQPQSRVLDLATGTGDLAIEVAKRTDAAVIGVDPSQGMLRIADRKIRAQRLHDRIELDVGTAESLPFPDQTFDAACMAFGIRNVPDRPRGLRELFRVLKPGGRLAILELSEPQPGLFAPLARFHVHTMVPWLGSLLSGAREYRYLQRSIAAFPPPSAFSALLVQAGFETQPPRPLTLGVVHLYVALRHA
jgi:demethylmenaquinone methyltransferase/2-methoxy-6-polyprenyl-1,4-benzoquinol methylase